MDKNKYMVELTRINVEIIINTHCFFNDLEKTALWLRLPNLNLGGSSPIQMMRNGRSDRLLKWILNALDENETPKLPEGS